MARDANGLRDDGVRVTRAGGVRRDLWGLIVLAIGVVAGMMVLREAAPPAVAPPSQARLDSPSPVAPAAGEEPGRTAPTIPSTMPHSRGAKLRALRALGVTPERGPDGKRHLDAAPVIDALNRAGIHDGIAAFPKPGTDPPKSGVIVPEGWELPEGYVRHHQSTDDGKPLPPILMFHPDYTFTDGRGNPVAIPADRVVPPDLVPPGFPVQRLDIPARDASR